MPKCLNLNESALDDDGFTVAQVPDTVKPKLVAGKWWMVASGWWVVSAGLRSPGLRVECLEFRGKLNKPGTRHLTPNTQDSTLDTQFSTLIYHARLLDRAPQLSYRKATNDPRREVLSLAAI